MSLTPLEIRKQEFKKSLRGYDPVEVETFLEMVSKEMQFFLNHNKELKEQVLGLETQLRDYKNIEKTLQQTLLQAQETTGRSIENSRKEAQLILQEAEIKASQILDKARMDLAKVKEDVSSLKAKKESLVTRLKVLLSSELELMRALEIEEEDILRADLSHGTGKPAIEIEEIVRGLEK
ncbi:MAG: DivIVA domain-containing protein [Bacteroidota bacterium]